jgi:hypothetical protein
MASEDRSPSGAGVPAADRADLDRVIDVVAREMTAVEAMSDLRNRVLEQLCRGLAPGHGWFATAWAWVGSAVAMAAAVALGLWLLQSWRMPVPEAPMAKSAPAQADTDRVGPGAATRAAAVARPHKRRSPHATVLLSPAQYSSTDVAELPPLPDIAPVEIEDVTPAPIYVPDVEVEPLPEMVPLSIPEIQIMEIQVIPSGIPDKPRRPVS